jgi:hypothetical protein
MSAPVVPAAVNEPAHAGEQVVVPVPPATLTAVEEMLDRQRNAFLQQTHDMLVEAVDRVVAEHGTPLARELRTSLVQTLEDVQRRQMEPFFEKTRETIQDVVNKVTEERLRPLVNELRETLLRTADDLQKQQLDPLLARTRTFLLKVADDLRDKYTAPLADQVKKTLLETVDEMRRQQAEPFLDVVRGLAEQLNKTLQEQLLTTLRVMVLEPLQGILSGRVPIILHGTGTRVLDYIIAGALFCIAAVLVCLALVRGLQELKVPDWLTFLAVGLAALLAGLIFYRKRWQFWQKVTANLTKTPSSGLS